jgi:AAA domain
MSLPFADPNATETAYRVMLWAAPGEGKTVGACSAPGPILALSADRPTAYKFARQRYPEKDIREYRWEGLESLTAVYNYVRSPEGADVRTVIVDPASNIVDAITEAAPRKDGGPDYAWVNAKFIGFVRAFRPLDINVVLCAYEKWNDHKKHGDGNGHRCARGEAPA